MSENKVSIDFFPASVIFLMALFWGEPDIADGIIYKLTGVKDWAIQEEARTLKDESITPGIDTGVRE